MAQPDPKKVAQRTLHLQAKALSVKDTAKSLYDELSLYGIDMNRPKTKGDTIRFWVEYGHGRDPFVAEVFVKATKEDTFIVPSRLDSEGKGNRWSAGSFRKVNGKELATPQAVKAISAVFNRAAASAERASLKAEQRWASKTARTKTAGEIRFIKDQGANQGRATWGWEDYRMSPPNKRHITSDFDFKVHRVPALARVLRSTLASLGHAMRGYEKFCKIKGADISPDGALGGRGYIMKIADMRRQYVNILEALSTMSDTLDDEIRAPHWKVLMARNAPEAEDAMEIVEDARQIKEDPEAWATQQEQEMDAENESSVIQRTASVYIEQKDMNVRVVNRYLERLEQEDE